jgi:hypothetical protein
LGKTYLKILIKQLGIRVKKVKVGYEHFAVQVNYYDLEPFAGSAFCHYDHPTLLIRRKEGACDVRR